jgi:hypothetical protein
MNKFKVIPAVIIFCSVIFSSFSNAKAGKNLAAYSFNQAAALNKIKPKMDDSIIGRWAGKHISIEVTEQGAKIEYDCASGTINKKIVLDKTHSFKVPGKHIEEHGGPVRPDEQSNGFPVSIIGRIKGKRMTLIVKRQDNNKLIGTFILFRGQESTLVKCR